MVSGAESTPDRGERYKPPGGETPSMKRVTETDAAPAAVGAYSQATTDGSLLFTAGQIPLTPDGELLDDAPIGVQTERALDNLVAILEAEGAGPSDVLKVTVFLDDIDDFEAMNGTYAEYFDDEPPARSAVEVGALPKGVGVEIEAVATLE
jgi:reactive intermediate/imine deaminase